MQLMNALACLHESFTAPLPTKPSARHWNASFLEMRSLRMELMISLKNSSFCDAQCSHLPQPGALHGHACSQAQCSGQVKGSPRLAGWRTPCTPPVSPHTWIATKLGSRL